MLLWLWLRIGRARLGCSDPFVGAGVGLSVRMALVVQEEEEEQRRGGAAELVVDVLVQAMIGWEQVSSSS